MWVRGLKQVQFQEETFVYESHPMWVRGLKLNAVISASKEAKVAPHVGAWIETEYLAVLKRNIKSHPMWVRGLKRSEPGGGYSISCRTPCGCVD